ncbi:MAG TPA: tRNA pseudouridine(38-40) synthase TruA [Acidimicrobiia bacterium]|jgi:tRNA pseudouridine38-40 synthase|nr:tRNA pseudouridine(38-40) synthase TruA [Acidimicrobiia bacterium]
MPVYRLDLAYDGSGFHGYARQPGVRTVQGDLEAALFHHTGAVDTFVAGRTDKGVHAAGQVASFATDAPLDSDRVRRSLNRQLAPEIAVLALAVAPDDFHARFSATGRSYRYLVLDREAPDPFLAATAWHYGQGLDERAMDAATAALVGEHDFASFCRRSGDRSTIRLVRSAGWMRVRVGLLAFDIEASSFCHQMVRSAVALSVEVGRGRVDAAAVPAIIEAKDRHAAKGAAPPHGLTLMRVDY